MNTLRLLLSVMVAITLVGCATTADNVTPASFRAAESVDNESCSTLDRSESAAVLSAAWQRCIAHYSTPNPSPVYNLMANQLSVEVITEANRTSVVLFARWRDLENVYLLADIETTPACASSITVRGRPVGWRNMAKHTPIWLEKPTDRGPSNCGG